MVPTSIRWKVADGAYAFLLLLQRITFLWGYPVNLAKVVGLVPELLGLRGGPVEGWVASKTAIHALTPAARLSVALRTLLCRLGTSV
jgi:hypothetical protein